MIDTETAASRGRARDGEGKKIAILRTAARLFSRQGYNETSMQDVARTAGIAVGTIYLYYRNKEDLLTGIYSYSSALLLDRITKRTAGLADPLEKYFIYLDDGMDYAFEHPDFFLIIFVDLRRKEIELPKRPAYSNFRRFLALGESIIAEGQRKGLFAADRSASRLNMGLVSMWVGLVLAMVLEPAFKAGPDERREVKDLVHSTVLEGILSLVTGGGLPPVAAGRRTGGKGKENRND